MQNPKPVLSPSARLRVNSAEASKIQNLKRRLVEGIQVITGEGVLSGSGHLSARIPGSWARPQQCALGESLPRVAVSAVETQSQNESANRKEIRTLKEGEHY